MKYFENRRRLRQTPAIRDLLSSVQLSANDLIQPYFVYQGLKQEEDQPSLTGVSKHTLDSVSKQIEQGINSGVQAALLFIIPSEKSEHHFNYDFDTEVISSLKKRFRDNLILMTDLCLCSNTVSGHCGILNKDGHVENAPSVKSLAEKSLLYAQAGSDCISPSDMMDSRIKAIRSILEKHHYHQTLIMSYSTKFSSHFYGPFRDAADSTPQKGDRKTYQLDFRNIEDALACSIRDKKEGADILMVKPAMAYLDMIYRIKNHPQTSLMPLCAYHVSGEWQSLHLMAEKGLIDFEGAYLESLYALKRAGSNMIITYGANQIAKIL